MSAVLARRILYDLLAKYAKLNAFSLCANIDSFNKNIAHPRRLRENLHYVREIADFAAHTQTDDQAQILEVTREEAEWTLDVIDRLFDYFIVMPEKDTGITTGFAQKIADASRKAIKPLPPDPPAQQEESD